MSIVVRAKNHPTGLRKMVGWYGEERKYPGDVFEIKSDIVKTLLNHRDTMIT